MSVLVYRSPSFVKYLTKLRRAGGRALLAAERAESIMTTLASESMRPGQVHRLTKFGERRIDGCQKYDLGSGYRLVYVKEGHRCVFLFVGTHDDCDRWLNNHKDQSFTMNEDLRPFRPAPPDQFSDVSPSAENEWDYDDILMQQIDEKTLCRIFHGLYRDHGT